jgi:hypothetical protein
MKKLRGKGMSLALKMRGKSGPVLRREPLKIMERKKRK